LIYTTSFALTDFSYSTSKLFIMENKQFKKLDTITELELFLKINEKNSGLAAPLVYLKSSKVFTLFSSGRMIGGFVLGEGSNLRTVELGAQKGEQNGLHCRLVQPKHQ